MKRSARFSRCGRYRYELWRSWPGAVGARGMVLVVGLNPSTADARVDDPTIRRCMGFARDWGFAELCVANLFAWRATRPASLKATTSSVSTCLRAPVDFAKVRGGRLVEIETKLNNRPRKAPGFRTPLEVFLEALNSRVATQS